QAGVAVVVQQRVVEAADAHRVLGQPFRLEALLEDEAVLPLRHASAFAEDLVRAAEDLDEPLVVVVGVDDHLDVQRLALAHQRRPRGPWAGRPTADTCTSGSVRVRSGTVEMGTPARRAALSVSPVVALPSLSSTMCGTYDGGMAAAAVSSAAAMSVPCSSICGE